MSPEESATADARIRKGRETRLQLIAAGRARFAESGYSGTRFDQIGKDLGMTAGAMYHHFRDKRDLFEAAARQCHEEIARKAAASAGLAPDIPEGIVRGCLTFIAEAVSPGYFRILLVDGISVLGWEAWKGMDSEFSERELTMGLREAQDAGWIAADVPAPALARFLSGGTNELALWVHHQADRKSALAQAETVLRHSLSTLRARTSGRGKRNPGRRKP